MATNQNFEKISLKRMDRAGLAFFTCDDLPGLFLSAHDRSNDSLRKTIIAGLECSFALEGHKKVNVYPNGDLSGPIVQAVVEFEN